MRKIRQLLAIILTLLTLALSACHSTGLPEISEPPSTEPDVTATAEDTAESETLSDNSEASETVTETTVSEPETVESETTAQSSIMESETEPYISTSVSESDVAEAEPSNEITGSETEAYDADVEYEYEFEEELVTFDELIRRSNAAILGEYVEKLEYKDYSEFVFKVKECIYGEVTESEIYLFSNTGYGYVGDIDYTYKMGTDVYLQGNEYILIMEKYTSVFYDHDRYMIATDLVIPASGNGATLYSKPITLPNNLKEYITSVYSSVPHETEAEASVTYSNNIEHMVNESDYIGVVKILSLQVEKTTSHDNTYLCIMEKLYKGSDLSTYENGTFFLPLLKGSVEVGNSYIIGFSKLNDGACVYLAELRENVYSVDDQEVLDAIANIAE